MLIDLEKFDIDICQDKRDRCRDDAHSAPDSCRQFAPKGVWEDDDRSSIGNQ